jgi:ketosteroid isomerase-like protein
MRLVLSFLALLCASTAPALAQNAKNAAPAVPTIIAPRGDPEAIQEIEDDWLRAERTTDPAALEKILSDDFVNLAPNGLAPGKTQLLKTWQAHAGQAPPYTVETSDMRIYILGDTAVAAYAKTYTTKDGGNVAHEDTTHIFVKDHGIWKLRISRSSFHQ